MTASERVLLDTIKKALFGENTVYPVDTDWDEVLREAQLQAISGIVFEGIPANAGKGWIDEKYSVAVEFAQKFYKQKQLIELFLSAGIPLAILKGTAAAVYYPVPGLRSMGDIDFIVPQDRFADARKLLLEAGYTTHLNAKETTEREMAFFKDGMEFELHYRFSDMNPTVDYYVMEGLKNIEYGVINRQAFPLLPVLANGIVLLEHLSHHLKRGLGIRQMIDWMMFVYKELDDNYWEGCFKKACDDTGLTTLAITATRMCQMYLGLPETFTWCLEADKSLCTVLLESLLAAGSFGKKLGDGNRVETVATSMRIEGFFRYMQRAGENNWKAYHHHHWLRPFAWVYQIGRYVRQGAETCHKGKIVDDIERSKKRAEMLKRLKL